MSQHSPAGQRNLSMSPILPGCSCMKAECTSTSQAKFLRQKSRSLRLATPTRAQCHPPTCAECKQVRLSLRVQKLPATGPPWDTQIPSGHPPFPPLPESPCLQAALLPARRHSWGWPPLPTPFTAYWFSGTRSPKERLSFRGGIIGCWGQCPAEPKSAGLENTS